MKTKITKIAFLIVALLFANVAKSQRNNTQIQERTSPQIQTIPTPPPTNYPVFNNDIKYVTPTPELPKPTPQPYNSLLDGSVINSTSSEQQKPLPPQSYNSLLDGAVIQGNPTKPKPVNPPNNTEEKMRGTNIHFKAKNDTTFNFRNEIKDVYTAVYFVNESTTNTFYDVIWDGVLICSISPGQSSSAYYAITKVNHSLLFRVKNTNTIACSFNVPPLEKTSYNFTCSY